MTLKHSRRFSSESLEPGQPPDEPMKPRLGPTRTHADRRPYRRLRVKRNGRELRPLPNPRRPRSEDSEELSRVETSDLVHTRAHVL